MRTGARVAIGLGLLLAAVVLILILATVGLLHTETGLGALLAALDRVAPGTVRVEGRFGSLDDEFGADRVLVTAGSTTIEIVHLRARLASYRLRPLALRFRTMQATRVAVTLTPGNDSSDQPPQQITPPLELSAEQFAVGEFAIYPRPNATDPTFALGDTVARVLIDPSQYRIENGRTTWRDHPIRLDGAVGGRRPFAIDARATLATPAIGRTVRIGVGAAGSLVDLALAAVVDSGDAHGTVAARIASFATQPLGPLEAHLAGIDPADWFAGAPNAPLALEANLAPVRSGGDLALRGRIAVANPKPGPLDANAIPFRALVATVAIDSRQVVIDRVDAVVAAPQRAAGNLGGNATISFGAPLRASATLSFRQVDPSALDTRAKPMAVDGTARIEQAEDHMHIEAQLAAVGAQLALSAQAQADQVEVEKANLALGAGRLEVHGTWRRRDNHVAAAGSAHNLDLGRVVTTAKTDLNGRFDVDAALNGPTGHATVDLDPSSACIAGAPCVSLRGRAAAQFEGGQRLALDADLAAGSATLGAHGAIAWPRPIAPANQTGSAFEKRAAIKAAAAIQPGVEAQDLRLDLVVPALKELDPRARGSITLHGTVAGTWPWPRVDAGGHAEHVAFSGRSIDQLQLTAHADGGADGTFHGQVDANALHLTASTDEAGTLQSLSATLDGRLSAHTLAIKTIAATTTAANTTATLRLEGALTGLSANPNRPPPKLGWHGQLIAADLDAPVQLHLVAPAALAYDGDNGTFGPAALEIDGGRFDDVELALRDGAITSRGTFHDVRPLRLSSPTGTSAPGRQSLTLGGRWQLQLGPAPDRADGEITVDRTGGDLVAGGTGPQAALGLTDLHLRLNLDGGRFDVEGALRGDHVGHAEIRGNGRLARGDGPLAWQVAPQAPLALSIDADLPSIEDLAPLAGDTLQGMRIGGHLRAALKVDGSVADPHAHGRVDGDGLRLAWLDQGVRLENGTLAATIDDQTVRLDQLAFSGAPRTRPSDIRASAHLNLEQAGTLTATGRYALRAQEGDIHFAAVRLPLLQRSDRWVVVSGDGDVMLVPTQVTAHGQVRADGGAIDISRAELPSLSPDVTIVRATAPSTPALPKTAFVLDLSIDLGSAFYLRGRGVDTRADGTLRLRSDGSGFLRGNGSLQAQDGTFEGFGQKMTIERGRLDFQGNIDNPGLDILALRSGLPVTVGVTITGTVAQPLVRVYSDPPLPDYEALSWLVLGRPPEQGGNDNLAIATAAAGLIGGTGPGIGSRLANRIGIDQISVRSGALSDTNSLLPAQSVAGPLRGDQTTPTTTQIVTVGKRIGQSLTISYEQVAGGAASIVQLSYQLSRRLSLLARAGTDNALDLVWTLSFD